VFRDGLCFDADIALYWSIFRPAMIGAIISVDVFC